MMKSKENIQMKTMNQTQRDQRYTPPNNKFDHFHTNHNKRFWVEIVDTLKICFFLTGFFLIFYHEDYERWFKM